ncbi:hypothetical protein [Persicirhabdus sediminis]|uniref:Uncharacterized protein n=1 Tax=Persicirhabdus sediminis TaxID=454144 RepID=A0A8J7MDF8_9BACT|nr:hypothetical protein [Persicirhabdus sediminis]MBK1790621.1 hypothetical protein [Persicirhabdus sediminis]
MTYYRYCAPYESDYTQQRYGVFIAVWHLIRDKKVSPKDEQAYWEARDWFEENLPIPPFHAEGNPRRAITWFKDSVMNSEVVAKLSIYRDIAQRYGTEIELISTEDPGLIIYEDEYQIASAPLETALA